MTCYHPIRAYRSREFNKTTGKYGIAFDATKALNADLALSLPCGRCIGCRDDKKREWALRAKHEAQMAGFGNSSFITLTYTDEHVPIDYSVKLRDWQLFMKRLRKDLGETKVRFLACGEYGDKLFRPHYHALIFGHGFPDRKLYYQDDRGDPHYKSAQLERLWPVGYCDVADVTWRSAKYVAGYVMKKMVGSQADDHYNRVSPIDGNTYRVATEFCVMSRRPGLGTSWFEKFQADAFPSDFLVVEGQKVKPPKFYLKLLDEHAQTKIKRARKRVSIQPRQRENSTPARLKVREKVQSLRTKRLLRKLES